jgi:hypothetical protein
VSLYRLEEPIEALAAPVMIAALDGWIDAAGAATNAADHLATGAERVVDFEGDVLFDFRSRRPTLDIIDGTLTEVSWPELSIDRAGIEGRDLLVLHGAEPDFRWRELGDAILQVCLRLGVVEWVSLGTIPAAVPHTRPVPVLGTASAPGLLKNEVQQGPEGLLRVPSAALSTIEMAVTGSGIPAVGFYGQVPHYVGGPFAPATLALLDHLGRHLGIAVPLGDLPEQAMSQRQRLDAAAASDDDTREYIERLERLVGEEQRIPSGDEIAQEFERFLRNQGGDRPADPAGSD